MRKYEVTFSLILIGIALFFVVGSFSLDYTSRGVPGPAFFPRWLGLILLVLGVYSLVAGLKLPDLFDSREEFIDTVSMYGLIVLTAVACYFVTMPVALMGFIAVVLKRFHNTGLKESWKLSVFLPAISAAIFWYAFSIRLFMGVFE